jgi:superfamily II DNA/RNA helicase
MSADDLEGYKRAGLLPEGFIPTTPDVRLQMRHMFESGELRRVIATDIWATGVDFAALSVLYRADGRSSEIMDCQGPGRVSRISPDTDKTHGEVVDCLDTFDSGMLRKSRSRKSSYAKMGWEQDWPKRLEV